MDEKNFTVAFLDLQHQLSLTSVYKLISAITWEKKGGKLTLVDLQPKKNTKQTPVQIFSTRCFNEKCAELLTWSLE